MDTIKTDIPALLGRLAGELSNLARDEVALAKIELRQSVKEAATDSAAIAAGTSVIYAGGLFVLLAATFGLGTIVPMWAAALIVGVASIIIGALTVSYGAARLKKAAPAFEHTKNTIEANGNALKESMTV